MLSARVARCASLVILLVVWMTAFPAFAQDKNAGQPQPPTPQTQAPMGPRAEVRNVSVASDDFGPVLEILATRTITPQIQTVENPLRLVIDLPNSSLATAKRRIPFRNPQIKGIRLNQYQTNPAVSRVVIDLNAPVRYTWDALGTRLRIRIRADESASAKPPSVPALTKGVQPAAVPVAVGSSGTLVETGSRVASGSSVTAGEETAIMRLTRGGEVRVCRGTTVSFTTSSNGNDLLLGMSQGSIETDYVSQESVDSVLPPDFRIVLPGPGQFNMAVSADAHGNTCVASLPGTTSSAIVAELLGSGTYEIKPSQQVLFRQGRIDSIETPVASCGCPPAREPVLRAENDPSAAIPDTKAGEKLPLATSNAGGPSNAEPSAGNSSAQSDSKPDQDKNQAKDDADAPLVFSGAERAKAGRNAPPPPVDQVALLKLSNKPPEPPPTVVLPPAPDPKQNADPKQQKSTGFFGKLKRFFLGK